MIASVALRVKMISSLRAALRKRAHLLARALVGFGRGIGEIVQAAMHVGVFCGVGLLQPIEHRLRLLRRGGVVEIDQRLAIDLHRQDRKILADAGDVVGAVADRRMHGHPRASSHVGAASISASRRPSCSIASTASPTKAWISSASASFSGMPRALR